MDPVVVVSLFPLLIPSFIVDRPSAQVNEYYFPALAEIIK